MISFDFDPDGNMEQIAAQCRTEPEEGSGSRHPATRVMGARVNQQDWAFRNTGDAFYIFYRDLGGQDRTLAWNPPDESLQSLLPAADDIQANVAWALSFLTDEDIMGQDW